VRVRVYVNDFIFIFMCTRTTNKVTTRTTTATN
jgi:hypothetical protein